MAVGDVYRLAIVGVGGYGQSLVNVVHYRYLESAVQATEADDLAFAWAAEVLASFQGTFSSQGYVSRLEVRGVTDPTVGIDFSFAEPQAGTLTGDGLPPQSAGVISWLTGKVGRRFRGRSFLWPATEPQQASGQWIAGYTTAMNAYATAARLILSDETHGAWAMVVHSRTFNISTAVSGFALRNTVYTQRRRVPGRGS